MMRQDDEYDDELWLSHCSCASWCNPDRWIKYFERVQKILGAKITHLDENDPIRRRFGSYDLAENANYVTQFGEHDQSRTIFGKLAAIGVDFSIWYFQDEYKRVNSFNWHGPPEIFDDPIRLDQIYSLFDCGNVFLDSFHSYADTQGQQKTKKKKEGGAVDLRRELGGVFWLTYFNERYVEFFGREKFTTLEKANVTLNGGATIRLAATPADVPEGLRREVEVHLGEKSFVNPDPKDFTVKHPGKYALTYDQLHS